MYLNNFYFLNEDQLLKHASFLRNKTLDELSQLLLISLPYNLKKNKGIIGQLIELFLGIKNNNQTQPDFPNLGIELKTVVINHKHFPINNTFICPVPLINNTGLIWNNSYCYNKIKKILWIPILKRKTSSLKYFKILKPFLWSPSSEDMKILKKDWEEFMDLIILGNFKKITSEFGQFLHICIKSKNKNILTKAIGNLGEYTNTNPISFYFRKKFVLSILKKYCFNF